jgi:hypothetical protein
LTALIITKTPMLTTYTSPLQFKPELIALIPPKVGGSANSAGRFSSLAEMRALLTKCYKIKPVSYREYASSVKSPARFNPAGFYVQFQSGPYQGEMVDFTTIKNINDYLSSTDKVAFMDYGFRDMGLQQLHMRDSQGRNVTTVTLAEFRKINGAYEDALKDSGGSSTPAMRQALKDLNALGEKLYPATKLIKNESQQKTKAGSVPFGSNHGMQSIVHNKETLKKGANNSLTFQKKDRHDPEKPSFCTLTINRVHNVIRREGKFDSVGRAKIEPLAENELKVTGTLKTTYPNAKLSLQMSISNTDVGMVTGPTKISEVRHYPRHTYVIVEMNGFKSVIPEFLTPGELERYGTTFKGRTEKIMSMPDFHHATCIIDNKEAPIVEIYNKNVIQNGVLVRK